MYFVFFTIVTSHYSKVTFPPLCISTHKFDLRLGFFFPSFQCIRADGFIASEPFSEERITGGDVSVMDGGINVPPSSRGRSGVLQVASSAAVWPAD